MTAEMRLAQAFVAEGSALRRLATRILGNAELAEDVVQEAWLRLAEAAPDEAVRDPAAYCAQTVRRLAIDRHRRLRLEADVFAAEEEGAAIEAPLGSPEHIAIGREHLKRIESLLTALPRRTRQAFELHRLGGHTQQEVADRLGVSITLVNFMLRDVSRALAPWRDVLTADA